MNELAELAKLDGLIGGKKEEANMQSAMARNEKIRDWVSFEDIVVGMGPKLYSIYEQCRIF